MCEGKTRIESNSNRKMHIKYHVLTILVSCLFLTDCITFFAFDGLERAMLVLVAIEDGIQYLLLRLERQASSVKLAVLFSSSVVAIECLFVLVCSVKHNK